MRVSARNHSLAVASTLSAPAAGLPLSPPPHPAAHRILELLYNSEFGRSALESSRIAPQTGTSQQSASLQSASRWVLESIEFALDLAAKPPSFSAQATLAARVRYTDAILSQDGHPESFRSLLRQFRTHILATADKLLIFRMRAGARKYPALRSFVSLCHTAAALGTSFVGLLGARIPSRGARRSSLGLGSVGMGSVGTGRVPSSDPDSIVSFFESNTLSRAGLAPTTLTHALIATHDPVLNALLEPIEASRKGSREGCREGFVAVLRDRLEALLPSSGGGKAVFVGSSSSSINFTSTPRLLCFAMIGPVAATVAALSLLSASTVALNASLRQTTAILAPNTAFELCAVSREAAACVAAGARVLCSATRGALQGSENVGGREFEAERLRIAASCCGDALCRIAGDETKVEPPRAFEARLKELKQFFGSKEWSAAHAAALRVRSESRQTEPHQHVSPEPQIRRFQACLREVRRALGISQQVRVSGQSSRLDQGPGWNGEAIPQTKSTRVEIFENQRFRLVKGWSVDMDPSNDPPSWSDSTGTHRLSKEFYSLPPGCRWRGDWYVESKGDVDGWSYSKKFGASADWIPRRFFSAKVRRRRWCRVRVKTEVGVASNVGISSAQMGYGDSVLRDQICALCQASGAVTRIAEGKAAFAVNTSFAASPAYWWTSALCWSVHVESDKGFTVGHRARAQIIAELCEYQRSRVRSASVGGHRAEAEKDAVGEALWRLCWAFARGIDPVFEDPMPLFVGALSLLEKIQSNIRKRCYSALDASASIPEHVQLLHTRVQMEGPSTRLEIQRPWHQADDDADEWEIVTAWSVLVPVAARGGAHTAGKRPLVVRVLCWSTDGEANGKADSKVVDLERINENHTSKRPSNHPLTGRSLLIFPHNVQPYPYSDRVFSVETDAAFLFFRCGTETERDTWVGRLKNTSAAPQKAASDLAKKLNQESKSWAPAWTRSGSLAQSLSSIEDLGIELPSPLSGRRFDGIPDVNGSTNGNDSNAATTETRVPGKWHPVNAFDFFGQLAAAIRRQILPSLARVRVAFDSEALFSVAFNSLWKLVVTSVLHTSLCLQPYPLHLSISTLQEITEHANERKSLETALGGCVRALLSSAPLRHFFGSATTIPDAGHPNPFLTRGVGAEDGRCRLMVPRPGATPLLATDFYDRYGTSLGISCPEQPRREFLRAVYLLGSLARITRAGALLRHMGSRVHTGYSHGDYALAKGIQAVAGAARVAISQHAAFAQQFSNQLQRDAMRKESAAQEAWKGNLTVAAALLPQLRLSASTAATACAALEKLFSRLQSQIKGGSQQTSTSGSSTTQGAKEANFGREIKIISERMDPPAELEFDADENFDELPTRSSESKDTVMSSRVQERRIVEHQRLYFKSTSFEFWSNDLLSCDPSAYVDAKTGAPQPPPSRVSPPNGCVWVGEWICSEFKTGGQDSAAIRQRLWRRSYRPNNACDGVRLCRKPALSRAQSFLLAQTLESQTRRACEGVSTALEQRENLDASVRSATSAAEALADAIASQRLVQNPRSAYLMVSSLLAAVRQIAECDTGVSASARDAIWGFQSALAQAAKGLETAALRLADAIQMLSLSKADAESNHGESSAVTEAAVTEAAEITSLEIVHGALTLVRRIPKGDSVVGSSAQNDASQRPSLLNSLAGKLSETVKKRFDSVFRAEVKRLDEEPAAAVPLSLLLSSEGDSVGDAKVPPGDKKQGEKNGVVLPVYKTLGALESAIETDFKTVAQHILPLFSNSTAGDWRYGAALIECYDGFVFQALHLLYGACCDVTEREAAAASTYLQLPLLDVEFPDPTPRLSDLSPADALSIAGFLGRYQQVRGLVLHASSSREEADGTVLSSLAAALMAHYTANIKAKVAEISKNILRLEVESKEQPAETTGGSLFSPLSRDLFSLLQRHLGVARSHQLRGESLQALFQILVDCVETSFSTLGTWLEEAQIASDQTVQLCGHDKTEAHIAALLNSARLAKAHFAELTDGVCELARDAKVCKAIRASRVAALGAIEAQAAAARRILATLVSSASAVPTQDLFRSSHVRQGRAVTQWIATTNDFLQDFWVWFKSTADFESVARTCAFNLARAYLSAFLTRYRSTTRWDKGSALATLDRIRQDVEELCRFVDTALRETNAVAAVHAGLWPIMVLPGLLSAQDKISIIAEIERKRTTGSEAKASAPPPKSKAKPKLKSKVAPTARPWQPQLESLERVLRLNACISEADRRAVANALRDCAPEYDDAIKAGTRRHTVSRHAPGVVSGGGAPPSTSALTAPMKVVSGTGVPAKRRSIFSFFRKRAPK